MTVYATIKGRGAIYAVFKDYSGAFHSYNSDLFSRNRRYQFQFETLDDEGDIIGSVQDDDGTERHICPYNHWEGDYPIWELSPKWIHNYVKRFGTWPSENIIKALGNQEVKLK